MTDTRHGDHERATGSVADEAALLADLLASRGWGGLSPGPAPSAPGDGEGPAAECTCGGTTPAACRLCPVCQLIAFVQQVSPDTVERVAEIVDLAATALRDLAQSQRERTGERDGERDGERQGEGGGASTHGADSR
ncbi:hypothetical protein [Intrasporangium calvum]|uniref:Uncharacterized protein n=1 Tax=Intrasporangium calvum (strain ATCC 23552 / DSM 43043 / JCM 3097 / NBRC 12989 / NCIMB 10167 / NRRL B-3866 / 7 KIP) TaxID=710696 RepID=E6SBX5_INTC7|nr:hypothetical protein [Intrasporangium calvum]ADU48484.1 hypothetical protein Intca_1973 [Intrasporangium calvum DSM 43043]AXG13504.1 hypothetical protein DN585_08920 [Intrasporangium calvum]